MVTCNNCVRHFLPIKEIDNLPGSFFPPLLKLGIVCLSRDDVASDCNKVWILLLKELFNELGCLRFLEVLVWFLEIFYIFPVNLTIVQVSELHDLKVVVFVELNTHILFFIQLVVVGTDH